MAYSYSRRRKLEVASACNTAPHISVFFLPPWITLFFPLQWPPAPVADTSVRLPPLAEQAMIALQDPVPVAYSYGSQSKRNAAFAHNTDPHISLLVLLSLLRFYQFPTSRSRGRRSAWYCLRSLLYLTSPYSLLQQHHCSSHQMLLPRCHR